jgi:hypothetical protein
MRHCMNLASQIAQLKERLGAEYSQSAEYFDFARQFCIVYGAACVMHWFLYGQPTVTEGFGDPAWLACALDRLWSMMYPLDRGYHPQALAGTRQLLDSLYRQRRLFSFVDARVE